MKSNRSVDERVAAWFESRGWTPFPFQIETWQKFARGESGLIHSSTGTGKTYAAWFAPLLEWMNQQSGSMNGVAPPPIQVLWLTPLRALAADTVAALQAPLSVLEIPWTVERRTGDVSSSVKQRQNRRLPSALVTTPESLSLLLSRGNSPELFAQLKAVVVDEWHELLGTKRGVQTELGLARLRRWNPNLRIWGLSATLGNLDTALTALLGSDASGGAMVQGHVPKEIRIDSLIPDEIERFPWAGHLGLRMLPAVIQAIEESATSLIFTNTRNQAERWYQSILAERPDWAGELALHHGSLDGDARHWVEEGLRSGQLRSVVATSSLDLGVDFSPVDRVLQIGSPKGVARLLQRAGRSGHQPGAVSRVTCVPTNAFELIEISGARSAAREGKLENRDVPERPLDLLVQHLVTIALGTGFYYEAMKEEVRSTYAFRDLSDEEWDWALGFIVNGGDALGAYPEYRRVEPLIEDDAHNEANDDYAHNWKGPHYKVTERSVARRHRLSIGTIVSDPTIQVQYLKGRKLGTVDESFVSRLRPGDRFIFAGVPLTFVRLKDLTAIVRRAKSTKGAIPRWTGTRMPLSTELAAAVRRKLEEARDGHFEDEEMLAVGPIMARQADWSQIPGQDEFLIESVETREGHHLFLFPFAGRLVHEGLAALFAYRISQLVPITFTVAANDYGFELLSDVEAPLDRALEPDDKGVPALLSRENLLDEIPASLNAAEMARRQFREIAQIAGLVFTGLPGRPSKMKHVQASSGLFFDVFSQYDTDNLLLEQAHREVLERQLERSRLGATLTRLAAARRVLTHPPRPTPLAFPLLVARMQAEISSEKLADRVRKLQVEWGL